MDALSLSKVSTLNIVQILKKCNDISFVRSIRTCHRIHGIANEMEKETRIFCSGFLVVFVYFDQKKGKVMFDVPYTHKRREGLLSKATDRLHKTFKMKQQLERKDEEKFELHLFASPRSRLHFVMSDVRKRAFHRKMTPEQLCRPLPEFLLSVEEVLKTFPSIRAKSFAMDALGRKVEDDPLVHRTYLSAHENFKFKELRFIYHSHHSPEFGYVEHLKIDWYQLETLKAQCLEENFDRIHRDLITKWESGQTNLKDLELRVSKTGKMEFQNTGFFVEIEASPFSGSNWHFHYLHFVCNNRWAITYFCAYSKNTYHFHDISDCDGCDCQTEFCFKKLMEVLAKGLKWDNVVDFGPVVDEWNGMEEKAMEKLGTLLKPDMIRIHRPHHCCG